MKKLQLIEISVEELKELINDAVKREIDDLKKNFQPKKPNEYLTRSEIAKLLRINLSTVHNWTKRDKLISYGIGGRVYYKRSEVEKAIIRLK